MIPVGNALVIVTATLVVVATAPLEVSLPKMLSVPPAPATKLPLSAVETKVAGAAVTATVATTSPEQLVRLPTWQIL